MVAKTKRRNLLTLTDRLSRLTYRDAVKILGEEGEALLRAGGAHDVSTQEHVALHGDVFRLTLPDAVVNITLERSARQRLRFECSSCSVACEHAGAAFSLILEEKMALGLAAPPPERAPVESLSDEELVQTAIEERMERARGERMRVKSLDPGTPWTDYAVTNATSGKSYRVALRGLDRGDSYCSCPDFRKNTLGTCKHILNVLRKVQRRFASGDLAKRYRQKGFAVHLKYGAELELRLLAPQLRDERIRKLIRPLQNSPITNLQDLLKRIRKLEGLGRDVLIYPDAEEYIDRRLFQERMKSLVRKIRANPEKHPLRRDLLKVELLPYQLDGVAFAAGVGRAILADDMGLGKTIQGVGTAELLAREAGIARVLVVCPATVKTQWRAEIHRFCDRSCQLVLGKADARREQYMHGAFFTICNYEQVLRDLPTVEAVPWDLIILDEGQRIKNWESKTSGGLKALRSRFALVLTGTPLENRLDDLFSVVEFVDDRRLGPAFRFYNRHRVVDKKGKVLGYKNLGEVRKRLAPVLLRRTRGEVLSELPPRHTEIVRVAPHDEQLKIHGGWMQVVSSIVNKKYITEMDLLRLQKALLMCRLSADSTCLVTKDPPGYSSKLEKLDEIFEQLAGEDGRKVILFSEWTRMLDRIEKLLEKRKIPFVRLDGSVPQKLRQKLVHSFQNDPAIQFFLLTNAGATGLNLQAANTVINVDLPWNPAVLEQRIGRAHRMGQKSPVQVFVLVTEETIEDNLLATLSAKHELAEATLDLESTVEELDLSCGMEELKRRLEVLLGARPEAPLDASEKARNAETALELAHRERVASAGGQLLASALTFLQAVVPASAAGQNEELVQLLKAQLDDCTVVDANGRPTLTLTLPDSKALDDMSRSLASIVAGTQVRQATPAGERDSGKASSGRSATAKTKRPGGSGTMRN